MSGVSKIEIAESVTELKMLMKQQKTGLRYAKVQSLYLLKIKAVENINYLAIIIGRGESTIHRWLHLYRNGGLSLLLEEPLKTGRPKKLEIETVAKLQQELSDPEVNPIERVWEYIKSRLRSQWFIDLDDVKEKVARILNSLSTDTIISLASWECFINALSL
jgi:transposase